MKKVWIITGIALVAVIILVALKNTNSKPSLSTYTYIEESNTDSSINNEEKTEDFEAQTDSAAYLYAFQKFHISKKAVESVKKTTNYNKIIIGFKLLNSNKTDITSLVDFQKKDSLELSITQSISGINLDHNLNQSNNFSYSDISPDIVKKLEPLFRIKKDEFDPQSPVFYTPKTAPNFVNIDATFCYFNVTNNLPSNLRFRLQYENNEWLFIEKCQFLIDGKAFEYYPINIQHDSGNGGRIWEWFDDTASINDALIIALYNAKKAKVKLIGNQYHDIITISNKELKSIKNTIDLYRALGGN